MSSCSNKRKSKARQPTPKLLIPKKVTLTDLCSEEKGKIGELIILIEKHRLNNTSLSDEIKGLKATNKELSETNIRLQHSNQQKDCRITELLKVIDEIQDHLSKREEEIRKKAQTVMKNQFVQTQVQTKDEGNSHYESVSRDELITIHTNTQTEDGFFNKGNKNRTGEKEKSKDKHSKAYKKIMNSLSGISKAVEQQLSHKSSKNMTQSMMSQIEQQGSQFSDLAKLWMRMKKQDGQEVFKINPYKSVDSVVEEEYDAEYLINRYKKMKLKSQYTPEKDLIDQYDLNAKLKNKDFKANDLLKSSIKSEKDKKTIQFY